MHGELTLMEEVLVCMQVLLISFALCTFFYTVMAVMGYTMYGDEIENQITLNLPDSLWASRIAIWTTVVNPITKYAITLTPVALALEGFFPTPTKGFSGLLIGTMLRSLLVISGTVIALTVPFFAYVMAFIGALLSMTISVIIPCACYLSLLRGKLALYQQVACSTFIAVGVIAAVLGTASSVASIFENLTGGGD